MDRKNGVKINSRKLIVFLTLVLFMFQCLPLMTFGATGKATVIKEGNTPTAPTNVKASLHISGNTKYVTITWSPSKESEKGIAQYRVYRNGKLLGSTVNCSYTDRTVKVQEKYQYKVVGIGNNTRESKPGVSNTVNLVEQQTVINAKTGESSLRPFKNPPTYKKVTNVKTGSTSFVLKPTALKTSLGSVKLKSGLGSNGISVKTKLTSGRLSITPKAVNGKLNVSVKSTKLSNSLLSMDISKSPELSVGNLAIKIKRDYKSQR